MAHFVRIAALLAAFAGAGCISNDEITQASPVTAEPASLFADMHAAIPANKGNRNTFEYN